MRPKPILVSFFWLRAGVRFIVLLVVVVAHTVQTKFKRRKLDKLHANMAAELTGRQTDRDGTRLLRRVDDPNKLKATKINYENFHFTFEFLVTCNFVKLMRLFGVSNLIMKMSLCKFVCLSLSLSLPIYFIFHSFHCAFLAKCKSGAVEWNSLLIQLSRLLIMIFITENSWCIRILNFQKILSYCCPIQNTKKKLITFGICTLHCATRRLIEFGLPACSCHVKRKQFTAKLLHGSACRFPVIRFYFTSAWAANEQRPSPFLLFVLLSRLQPGKTRSGTCRHV